MEERRVSLEEKAQVMEMVKLGVYSPRTARQRIEKIDQSSGSHDQRQVCHPSMDCRSPSWDIEDPERFLNESEEEI